MNSVIQLAHGGGGRLSAQLINEEILTRFGNGPLKGLPDAARLPASGVPTIFSTDSFVVHPLIFPGGNIGNLAVHGTVNDISVCGGKPLWLSLGLILEEGLPLSTLRTILDSIKKSADECGVKIVTGDTKVVAKGQCDGMYISTSGLGEAIPGFNLSRDRLCENDVILASGSIGDHGMAVLSAREGICIENGPVSDTASVHRLVQSIQLYADNVRFMRDPTRGGTAAVLNEIITGTEFEAVLDNEKIPVSPGAMAVSEILGIDILNVACEGRMILICSPGTADKILSIWKNLPEGKDASAIGSLAPGKGRVILKTITGGSRLVDVPTGELLPRIC